MATNNFLTFAGGAGSNVLTQAEYAALAARTSGFLSGLAKSAELNKVWRQSSVMAAVLGQFINDSSGQDAIDDGTTTALLASLKASVRSFGGLAVFTSSGSFTVPAGVTTIYVSGGAGGGGGGGTNTTSASSSGGAGGGGAGQSAIRAPYTVTPGQVLSVTIGAAGSAGAVGGNGGNGGNTVLGSLVTFQGGFGGASGSAASTTNSNGGAGGVGFPGGDFGGDSGSTLGAGSYSGGGGASAFGAPGRRIKGNAGNATGGTVGSGYCAGGSGAGGVNGNTTGTGAAGGAGLPGVLMIEW